VTKALRGRRLLHLPLEIPSLLCAVDVPIRMCALYSCVSQLPPLQGSTGHSYRPQLLVPSSRRCCCSPASACTQEVKGCLDGGLVWLVGRGWSGSLHWCPWEAFQHEEHHCTQQCSILLHRGVWLCWCEPVSSHGVERRVLSPLGRRTSFWLQGFTAHPPGRARW